MFESAIGMSLIDKRNPKIVYCDAKYNWWCTCLIMQQDTELYHCI